MYNYCFHFVFYSIPVLSQRSILVFAKHYILVLSQNYQHMHYQQQLNIEINSETVVKYKMLQSYFIFGLFNCGLE